MSSPARLEVRAPWPPAGGQPAAIDQLTEALKSGSRFTTLLGITGSGKSATVAWTLEQLQRPALVIAPNKSLAAQLVGEFKDLFPKAAVEYFVSYYDYYQPEAYVAASDVFIEKEATINAEIDRMRHSATSALATRRDVIIVASVSCIYALGPPAEYADQSLTVATGEVWSPRRLASHLVAMGYSRAEFLERGRFRVRGDTIEIRPPGTESLVRIELFGDDVDRIRVLDALTGEVLDAPDETTIFPATHWLAPPERLAGAVDRIQVELNDRLKKLRASGRDLEARRLETRTRRDVELLSETGFCPGIENYSAQLEGRPSGDAPWTLLDYFPADLVVVLDESHVGIPQIGSAFAGDRSRKQNLVDHGFRLPSALDNRPLSFDEFLERAPQLLFVSATPGPFELEHSTTLVEQIVRPTGLLDPTIEVCPTEGQIDDLLSRIRERTASHERVLVTCLTKKMAEDLAEFLAANSIQVRYLHSDVETLERIELLRDLRLGVYDVLVGINLLREGLDLPEVSLVVILDADHEGFLRSKTALMQTIGRAARNVKGHVVLYGDKVTPAMRFAIDETDRRRIAQATYNQEHGIEAATVSRAVAELFAETDGKARTAPRPKITPVSKEAARSRGSELESAMALAAAELRFEDAARLRDEIAALKAYTTATD